MTTSKRARSRSSRRPKPIGGVDPRSLKIATRFWSYVDRSAGSDECWPWGGRLTEDGYGQFRVDDRIVYAHRFAWIATYGPIPDELIVCHRCDNRQCVRPTHFFLGTYQDNDRDRRLKGRATYEKPRMLSERTSSRLTADERQQIVALYESGYYTRTFLARLYGVNKSTVDDYIQKARAEAPSRSAGSTSRANRGRLPGTRGGRAIA